MQRRVCRSSRLRYTRIPVSEKDSSLRYSPQLFPSSELSFVGRRDEMAMLREAVRAAKAGQMRLVAVAEEPGTGKTRTALELAAHAEQNGFQVLWGRCYEGEGAPPYWPWVQILRSFVARCNADSL